jgi:mannose-6-phosphate isomerase-like protein (cupin superfamily)
MKGYVINLEEETKDNENFRRVLYTAHHSQLVLMCLKPGEEIGNEVHPDHDQFFRLDAGEGKVVIDNVEHMVKDGFGVVVPAGAWHNVINTSTTEQLKLYTIYSPAEHKDGTLHHAKADAEADNEHFDGITSE